MALLVTPNAFAFTVEEVAVGYGSGTDAPQWLQFNALSRLGSSWALLKENNIQPYLDLGFAASLWQVSDTNAYHLSATAVLRTRDFVSFVAPVFFEVGFGPHLISKANKTDRLSTTFEFNSHIGVGVAVFKNFKVILRARHLSNAGIAGSNLGVNLYLWQLHYHF